jgi:hypothetical protein
MAAASRSLATALWGARFASGLLRLSYTTNQDTTLSNQVVQKLFWMAFIRRIASGPQLRRMGP